MNKLQSLLLLISGVAVVVAYDHPIFLVSKAAASTKDQKLCITVDEGDETSVSLQICNFDGAPQNQIWYRRDYEDFSTALEDPGTRCLGYKYDDEDKILSMTDCDLENPLRTSWWQEYLRGDGTALQFQDYGEETLCVAGEAAAETTAASSPGDLIQMLPCQDSAGFAWQFHYASCLPLVSSGYTIRLCVGSACAKYMDNTNTVEMVDTQESDVWLFDSRDDDALCMGTGLVRLGRDPSLCLQQGHGGGSIRDGTWLRVYPCECNHPYQQFYCGDPAKTRSAPHLRMSVNNEGHRVILRTVDAPHSYPLEPQFIGQTHPLVLLSRRRGLPRRVEEGRPVVVQDPDNYSVICLFQQGDGNLRILRSQNAEQCERNAGHLLFHSGLSMELAGIDSYITQIQRDGNLVTRKTSTMEWGAWSTCSANRQSEYSLVLNPDDTLAIMDEIGRVTWKSDTDTTCLAATRDPLVLMRSADGQGGRTVRHGQELSVQDRKSSSDVCLVQQADGNFRVVRVGGCGGNNGVLLFHSGLSKDRVNGEKYFTVFQKDGNLVTRKEDSGDWAWASCSSQDTKQDDYLLVLNDDNSLSILSSSSGESIWNSLSDPSCFA